MNFNEAVEFKKAIGKKTIHDEIEYSTMVVPANKEDFQKYCAEYINSNFNDEAALDFSSNGIFEVYGLHISHGYILLPKKIS